MALKDYYIEKAAGESAGSLVGADKWALKYINVNRARTILEAFDDDASGFVTIQEVNNFTRARPLDWGLVIPNMYSHYSNTEMNYIAFPTGWHIGQSVRGTYHSVADPG